jgi:hypothetical protein
MNPKKRSDYVYLISTSDHFYVGMASTPGRTLQHFFGAKNSRLRDAIESEEGQKRWPRLWALPLKDPNLEDLANTERLLIEAGKWDRRFHSKITNSSDGNALFDPEPASSSDPGTSSGQRAFLAWRPKGGKQGDIRLVGASTDAQDFLSEGDVHVEKSARFLSESNRDRAVEALRGMATEGFDPSEPGLPWQPFFAHLKTFGIGDDQLPFGTEHDLPGLASALGGPYVLVNLAPRSLDSRGSVGMGLSYEALTARAEGFWSKAALRR